MPPVLDQYAGIIFARQLADIVARSDGRLEAVYVHLGDHLKPGDAIAIPPGKRHKIWNTGRETLKLLCCCAPPYEHNDTVITET